MPDVLRRVQAYSEKTGQTAARGRLGSGGIRHGYTVSAGAAFVLERGVQAALNAYPGSVPSVWFAAYLAAARQVVGIIRDNAPATARIELLALEDRLAARGLSRTVWRTVVAGVFGFPSPVPPFVEVEDVNTGSYVGDGGADRVIPTGLTGTLRCLIVARTGGSDWIVHKTNTMAGKLCSCAGADRNVVAFVGLNFTVDSDVNGFVNAAGVTYHWTAWSSTP